MPAPAVIPAPIAYSKIVAIKTLVVNLRDLPVSRGLRLSYTEISSL